jgi:hypothetical protein
MDSWKTAVNNELWELCILIILIFLAIDKKYLLNAFTISWWLVIKFPSIFNELTLSVFSVLLVSKFTTSQRVLFLFKEFLISLHR